MKVKVVLTFYNFEKIKGSAGKKSLKKIIAYNEWCYTKEAIISTKVDAEYKCLFNYKCFCGTLNRLFCIARVSGSLLTKLKFKIWEHK